MRNPLQFYPAMLYSSTVYITGGLLCHCMNIHVINAGHSLKKCSALAKPR